jgi:hypothetical protein
VVSLAVLFEVLPAVVEPDPALLEEAVEFMARLKAEDAAELGGGQPTFAVLFEGNRFESGTGEVRTGGGKGDGQLVGKIEGDLHGASIAKGGADCTNYSNQRHHP